MLVTSYFLEVHWIYEKIMLGFLIREFCDVVNSCKISLSSVNEVLLYHFAMLMTDQQLASLKERKIKGDKFITNVYRLRIEHLILRKQPPSCTKKFPEIEKAIKFKLENGGHTLQWCTICKNLMTKKQSENIQCLASTNTHKYVGFNG